MKLTGYTETCLVGVVGNPSASSQWCHVEAQAQGQSIQVLKGSQQLDFYMKRSQSCKAGSPLSAVKEKRYLPGPTEELPFVISA